MCEKFQLSPFPRKTFEWNARLNEKSHNKASFSSQNTIDNFTISLSRISTVNIYSCRSTIELACHVVSKTFSQSRNDLRWLGCLTD